SNKKNKIRGLTTCNNAWPPLKLATASCKHRCKQAKKEPPHVQAHFILLVPYKIKRAFTSLPPPENKRSQSQFNFE
ncbi:hypothetical protein J1N10_20780, partial [Carboxylicivirga sp. A043]|uniref:hypothetical protein n=1 Tax=Carboxylicivirga litoralis TaxID=2816963 RepID=UPI0021CB7DC5